MSHHEQGDRVVRWSRVPATAELGGQMSRFGAAVVVGHPTFHNEGTIGALLEAGLRGASASFGGRPVSFIVSDGSEGGATLDAAEAAARRALGALPPLERERVQVLLTPYEGYGGDQTPGKGSALKLIFEEMGLCEASLLLLLDGDLRNDMASWHRVFARVEGWHRERQGRRPMFVTARYARHFVDASLTRLIVGPLTTLLGRYVPGGISGDIALSAEAVAKERAASWTAARRRYGTDISTTFDNLADAETVIYEVYLGAKLHDITDEAKLSAMPAQVIGAALERLIHFEGRDGRVTALVRDRQAPFGRVEAFGPELTGIGFVDPGATDAFDVDVKRAGLVSRFEELAPDIERVVGAERFSWLRGRVEALAASSGEDGAKVEFLGVDRGLWVELLQRAVGLALATGDSVVASRALNYLYTAAFLELVRGWLAELGLETLGDVRAAQATLAVPAERAEEFYRDRVDAEADALAMEFFGSRHRVVEALEAFNRRGAR